MNEHVKATVTFPSGNKMQKYFYVFSDGSYYMTDKAVMRKVHEEWRGWSLEGATITWQYA